MRKITALFLAVAMTSVVMTGTGSTVMAANTETSKTELKEYSLAVPFGEATNMVAETVRTNSDELEELTNGKVLNADVGLEADEAIAFVEGQIAAGVNGLIICPPSDSVLPTIAQQCEEAGVYWGITMRDISDPEIKELVEASPYYVGNCYVNDETSGYNCGKWMGEQGYKKIAIISQTKGDTTCDARERGLAQACEEYGMEIVSESRGHLQASDTTAAVESFLSANSDLDAVFIVGTTVNGAHEAAVKAIQDAGRDEDVKLVTIDFPTEIEADFESGVLVYSYGPASPALDPTITMLKVINAIQGTPINDDGSCSTHVINLIEIDNLETAKEYSKISGNKDFVLFDEEAIQELFKWENEDLTSESLQEILDNYKPF